MKTTIINYISLVFLFSLSLNSCKTEEAKTGETEHHEEENRVELTGAQFKSAGITFGKMEFRTISGTITATGMLDVPPQSKVSISAAMGGFVKSMELLQGSRVEKGQVVAVMQHPDYIQLQQDYLQNKSRLEFLKADYERQLELAGQQVNATKTVQEAKAGYFSAQAAADGLKAKLQLLNISTAKLEKDGIQQTINLVSPISGYVTKVNTNIGAFVNSTDVLIEIVNTEHLHAELTVFEKDVPLLKIGQRVLFTLANENKERTATVHLIGREINADRTVQVHCHLDLEDRELIPGMYLKAVVERDSAHVSALPEEAIVTYSGKSYIFIQAAPEAEHEHEHAEASAEKDGEKHGEHEAEHHFEMIEITTGEAEQGYVEVILPETFDRKANIVIKGAYNLLAKMNNSEEAGGHVH